MVVRRIKMVGFTVDELKIIAESIPYMLHEDVGFRTNLLTKVDKMINAYCEHESCVSFHEQFRWQLCGKCGVQYK